MRIVLLLVDDRLSLDQTISLYNQHNVHEATSYMQRDFIYALLHLNKGLWYSVNG